MMQYFLMMDFSRMLTINFLLQLSKSAKLFQEGDHVLTAPTSDKHEFCACPQVQKITIVVLSAETYLLFYLQIYAVSSSFRSAALFCSCPYNYNHAIYKGVCCTVLSELLVIRSPVYVCFTIASCIVH